MRIENLFSFFLLIPKPSDTDNGRGTVMRMTYTVTASYQMLGSTTPSEVMDDHYKAAIADGIIQSAKTKKVESLHGAIDFFEIEFSFVTMLDGSLPPKELGAKALATANAIVRDTDCQLMRFCANI